MEGDRERPRFTLTHYILVGLILGVLLGLVAPGFARSLSVLATIFVRLLQLLVVPLVFSSLVVAIGGWKAGGRSFGRLALGTLFFFVVATTFAGLVGLAAGDLLKPGSRGGVVEPVESLEPVSQRRSPLS